MRISCNMTNTESYIRIVLSFIVLITAVATSCYLLMLVAMVLAFTGIKKHCYLYNLLKINEKFSLKNYYISHLPKYNPAAVFMFDKNGKIYFENKAAQTHFENIKTFLDFNLEIDLEKFIKNNSIDTFFYNQNEKNYQIDIKAIQEIESVVVYLTDITELITLSKEMEQTQKEIIYTMGEIGETRSKETGHHVKRVAEYSKLLAILYGLGEEEAQKLKMASPMHDIGKVGIPDAVLNKPAALNIDEWKIMQTHAELGYEMLKKSNRPIIQAAAIVAHQHHEKWDGSGYPQGLSGENIHIYGRITAIADVFDALRSDRCYKKAWELDKILTLFQEEKGKHFDPKLVDLFFENLDSFIVISQKYKDEHLFLS